MLHVLRFSLICFIIQISCIAAEPVLHYDFTSSVIRKEGLYEAPKLPAGIKIASPQQALILTGEKDKFFFVIPGSEKLTLVDGGTLYALVKFNENGTKGGQNNAYDMIFFKPNEFLLGRAWGGLYFNGGGDKLEMYTLTKTVPTKKWTVLVASVEKIKTGYVVRLYIDGKLAEAKWFPVKMKTVAKPVSIGSGWGDPWYMNGEIGRLMFFEKALTAREIADLTSKEIYLKK